MSGLVEFKKKSRRNFRRKNAEDDNEEEGELEQAAEVNNSAKRDKKTTKLAPTTLLSFDDEEEESVEVFKVKKSKESRKLAKLREKAKKTRDEKPESKSARDERNNEESDKKLDNLRAELSNLGAEDEDLEKVDEIEEPKPTIEFKPSFQDGRRPGEVQHSFHIPDAAAIHAARKTREKARQLGGEYIPLDDTSRYSGRFQNSEKSRLVREDDNDQSDEEDDTGGLGFGTRKSNSHPALQRRLEVEKALAKDSGEEENSDEEDEALKRFEEEQIRKGVSIPQTQQEEDSVYTMYVQQQQMQDTTTTYPQTTALQYTEQVAASTEYPQYVYSSASLNTVTMDMICEKINNRVVSLQEVHRARSLEKEKIMSQLETCETSIVSLEKQSKDVEQRFGFFQEMRGYVRDLIECLNEKLPKVEDLERRMHVLLKQRADRKVERRQQDVKDQADTFAAAQTGTMI